VFKISSTGVFTVVHNMTPATDGEIPYDGIMQASDGNFYGTNGDGGSATYGTIFKMTTKDVVSTLHNFNLTAGGVPQVVPFQHTNGILYGDTNEGGTGNVSPCTTNACGVFYSLNATLPAFVRALPNVGKVGSQIGILGQGFTSASVVKFNGVTVTTKKLTGTTFILATVPAGASDGYITVTTGTTTLKTLKKFTVHNSWSSGTAMPTAVTGAAAGTIGTKIYVVGGNNSSGANVTSNQIYNTATGTWTTGAVMPTARAFAASAVVNNILYVIGGKAGSSQVSVVEAYNPTTNTWATKAAMPTARDSVTAAVEGGKIYVVGGYQYPQGRLDTVETYNPATNTWTEDAPLPVAKSLSAVGLVGTTIVSSGGLANSGITDDNEGYNATTNKWTALAGDPTARQAACSGTIGSNLYVAGGTNDVDDYNLAESFSVTADKWTTLAVMPQALDAPAGAVAGGLLYCFGGENVGVTTVYGTVQIYQP